MGVSLSVPFPFLDVGCVDGVRDNVGTLFSRCVRGFSVANLVSLTCPMASNGLVFSPPLVTPITSSWVVGGSSTLKVFPFPAQSTLQDVGVSDPNYLGSSSCPSSPSPSIEIYTTSLLSQLVTPSASTDSSSEESRVRYHLRNRSVVKGEQLVVDVLGSERCGWVPFLGLLLLVKVGVGNHISSWLKIGPGLTWLRGGNLQLNWQLE